MQLVQVNHLHSKVKHLSHGLVTFAGKVWAGFFSQEVTGITGAGLLVQR